MANNVGITLNENNDEDIDIVVTTNQPADGTIVDLTGLTLEAFLKTSAQVGDADPTTWKGSTVTSEITLTDPTNGKASISIPSTAVITTMHWWRVDVISGGKRKTGAFGSVAVVDL